MARAAKRTLPFPIVHEMTRVLPLRLPGCQELESARCQH